jgi:predicted transcriptional regulator
MAKLTHPQEIELWHLLPAIRRELTLELKSRGFDQKHIAAILGITEPAVSQYFNNKRASEIKFPLSAHKYIKKAADEIIKDNTSFLRESQKILSLPEIIKLKCSIHKSQGGVPKNCKICHQHGNISR